MLKRKINGMPLAYLDNAATTQKPKQVISALKEYYENCNSNVHRAVHTLSAEATSLYEEAHEITADFINAHSYEEVCFTKNTTEALNLVANDSARKLKKGDEIVLTQMEHHSNLVPWFNAAKLTGAKIKYAEVTRNGTLDLNQIEKLITRKTRIVSCTHISNVLGTINPVREIADMAHRKNALMILDAAQSVPHLPVDVRKLDADFMAFSGHKMLGPMGIGVLYGKAEVLKKTNPFNFGGDMIKEVTLKHASWNDLPWKFEAGTPNVAGAAGLTAAINYLKKTGMDSIREHGSKLTRHAMKKLESLEKVEVYGPKSSRGSAVSFNVEGIHPHDVSSILDAQGIAVRGGHHCAMPLMKTLGLQGSARASFYLYNTLREIDRLVSAVEKVKKIMKV